MRRFPVFAVLVLLFCAALVHAGTNITLKWNQTDAINVIAWYAYEVGNASGTGPKNLLGRATTTQIVLSNIAAGAHCYVVTASNAFGESAASNVACLPAALSSPNGLSISVTITVP